MGADFPDIVAKFIAMRPATPLFSERGHDLYWNIPRTLLQSRDSSSRSAVTACTPMLYELYYKSNWHAYSVGSKFWRGSESAPGGPPGVGSRNWVQGLSPSQPQDITLTRKT